MRSAWASHNGFKCMEPVAAAEVAAEYLCRPVGRCKPETFWVSAEAGIAVGDVGSLMQREVAWRRRLFIFGELGW